MFQQAVEVKQLVKPIVSLVVKVIEVAKANRKVARKDNSQQTTTTVEEIAKPNIKTER